MQYLPYCYDILGGIVLLCYIYGASKRGFAATLVRLVGYVAAFAAAWPLARLASERLFQYGLREGLLLRVSEKLAENPGSGELLDAAGHLLEGLPDYAARLLQMDSAAMDSLAEKLTSLSENGAQLVVDEILGPVVVSVLAMLLFVLIFSVLLQLVKLVTRVLCAANDIPVIGPLNSVLGGVAGLLMGIVALYVLLLALHLVTLLTGDSLVFLNNALLGETVTLRLLQRVDPFGLL